MMKRKPLTCGTRKLTLLLTRTHPLVSGSLARVPQELYHSYEDGEREADEEDDEDAADVADVERAGRLLLLVVLVTRAAVLPPLVVEHLNVAVLLQLQDCHGDQIAERRLCQQAVVTRPW